MVGSVWRDGQERNGNGLPDDSAWIMDALGGRVGGCVAERIDENGLQQGGQKWLKGLTEDRG